MAEKKLKGKPKVRPLSGSPHSCPQCELEVDSGKLDREKDVSIQYDIHFGDEVISFYRCDDHDSYETKDGTKTTRDGLLYTYSRFVAFKGIKGPKIPDHILEAQRAERRKLEETSRELQEYGDELAEKTISLEEEEKKLKEKGDAILKSEAELEFKAIEISQEQEQKDKELELKAAEEEKKLRAREKRLKAMVTKITTTEVKEDSETEAIRREAGLAPNYTFEYYAEFESNRFTCTAAKAVAANPANAYNPFIVHGPPGTGKTHLLQAIAYEIKRSNPDFNVKYVSTGKMKDQFLAAMQKNIVGDFIEDYETADVLILDDAQYLKDSSGLQERFAVIFTDMMNDGKQILINFDKPPSEIPQLDERLRSRFEGGLVREMGRLTPDEKATVLRTVLEKKYKDLEVSDDMIHSISSHEMYNNIRALNGALDKIHNYQTTLISSGNEPMTDVELCKEMGIKYIIAPPPGERPEKKLESLLDRAKEKAPEKPPSKSLEKPPLKAPEKGPEKAPEKGPEKAPEKGPEKAPEKGPEKQKIRKPPTAPTSDVKEPPSTDLKSMLGKAKGLRASIGQLSSGRSEKGKGKLKISSLDVKDKKKKKDG